MIEPLDPTENDLTVGEESSSTEEAEILEGDGITSTPGDEDIAGTATQTTGTDSKLCLAPNWLGDSYCDDANNVAECDFDQGDCCESKRQGNQYWDAFCQECIPMQC